jgi:hypothetical protein
MNEYCLKWTSNWECLKSSRWEYFDGCGYLSFKYHRSLYRVVNTVSWRQANGASREQSPFVSRFMSESTVDIAWYTTRTHLYILNSRESVSAGQSIPLMKLKASSRTSTGEVLSSSWFEAEIVSLTCTSCLQTNFLQQYDGRCDVVVGILAYSHEVAVSIPEQCKHLCAWTCLFVLGLGVSMYNMCVFTKKVYKYELIWYLESITQAL